jgi:hypothetical protein
MGSARLIMKFADGRLAWSERHWYYNGNTGSPPVPQTPSLATVIAAAQPVVQARIALLPPSSTMIGAVVSFDDSERDGAPLIYQGYTQGNFGSDTLDPELAVAVGATGTLGGVNYESTFYVSPCIEGQVNDQVYTPTGPFAVALQKYLLTLNPNAGLNLNLPVVWGIKCVQKNPLGAPPPAGNGYPLIIGTPLYQVLVPGPNTLSITLPSIPAGINTGSVVKLGGIRQTRGASMRLNGRWLVQGYLTAPAIGLVLTRKYFPQYATAANLNYAGGGYVIPTYFVIVPYSGFTLGKLTKHNRGGSLGLPRGRSRGRPANV